MERRLFLLSLVCVASLVGSSDGLTVFAKDGGDDDRDSGSDDHGGDRSGRGGGDDDDHDDDNDDRGGTSSGKGSGGSRSGRDRERIRDAVSKGRILPLKEILKNVERTDKGRIISVELNLKAVKPYYTFKLQSGALVKTVRFDASTGRKLNLFGW